MASIHLHFKKLSLLAVSVLLYAVPAFATPIFKGDTEYTLSGSFKWGDFGTVTFTDESTLYYSTGDKKLKIDGTLTSNKYPGEKFNLDLLFGQISYANKAFDNPATPELDVNFPKEGASGSLAKFGIPPGVQKGGMTMIGTLENQTAFNYLNKTKYPVPAGFDMPVLANMPSNIYASGNSLYWDAWIRAWGDFSLTNGKTLHIDIPTDLHGIKLTEHPHTNVPEPMSMSLLATGLLGAAITRKKKLKGA